MQKFSGLIFVAIIILFGVWQFQKNTDAPLGDLVIPGDPIMRIGGIPFRVGIANTDETRQRGLSGRESMEPLDGLFFIFTESGYHGIWMKNMNFAIDVIWISENLEVISITENIRPDSYPNIFKPPMPALYAVEIDAGLADFFGLRAGHKVSLPLGYEE